MNSDKRTYMGIVSVAGGGSIPPVMVLAEGLKSRGHRVVMICDEGSVARVQSAGLTPIVVPPDREFPVMWRNEEFRQFRLNFYDQGLSSISHLDNLITGWADLAQPVIIDEVKSHDPDLIFASLFSIGLADSLAPEIGKPWCMVNPAYYHGDDAFRPLEQDFVGFSPHMFREWLTPVASRADLVLHTTDREYDPVPGGLPRNNYHVGPLNEVYAGPPVEGLDESGDPWVLISVSTGPQVGEIKIVQSAIDILGDHPFRVIATAPQRSNEFSNLPANSRVVESASHDEVLKRSRFVISHAGHGAVMKALIYGVPMVLVPWDRDQPGVAARAEHLGVAVVVPREELSEESLRAAIDKLLGDESYQQRSHEVATRLATEDPVQMACNLVEKTARGGAIAGT